MEPALLISSGTLFQDLGAIYEKHPPMSELKLIQRINTKVAPAPNPCHCSNELLFCENIRYAVTSCQIISTVECATKLIQKKHARTLWPQNPDTMQASSSSPN